MNDIGLINAVTIELQVSLAVTVRCVDVDVLDVVDRTAKAEGIDFIAVQIDIQSIFFVTTAVELEFAVFDVTIQDDKKIIVIVTTEDFKAVIVGDKDVAVAVYTARREVIPSEVNQGDVRVCACINHYVAFDLVRPIGVDLAHVLVVHAIQRQRVVVVAGVQTKAGYVLGHDQAFSEVVGELAGEHEGRLGVAFNRVDLAQIRLIEGQVVVVHVDGVDVGDRHVEAEVGVVVDDGHPVIARALEVLDVAGALAVEDAAVDLQMYVGQQLEGFKTRYIFETIHPGRVEVVRRPGFGEVNRVVPGQTIHDVGVGEVGCGDDLEFVVVAVSGLVVRDVDTGEGVEARARRIKVSVDRVTARAARAARPFGHGDVVGLGVGLGRAIGAGRGRGHRDGVAASCDSVGDNHQTGVAVDPDAAGVVRDAVGDGVTLGIGRLEQLGTTLSNLVRAAVGLIQLQRAGASAAATTRRAVGDIEREVDRLFIALGVGEGHGRPGEGADVQRIGDLTGQRDVDGAIGVFGAFKQARTRALGGDFGAAGEDRSHGRRTVQCSLYRSHQIAFVDPVKVGDGVGHGLRGAAALDVGIGRRNRRDAVFIFSRLQTRTNGIGREQDRATTQTNSGDRAQRAQTKEAGTAGDHAHDTARRGRHFGVFEDHARGRIASDVQRVGRRERLRQRCGGRKWGDRRGRGYRRGAATCDAGGHSRAEEQHAGAVDEEVVGGHQQRLLIGELYQNRAVGELDVGHHIGRRRRETGRGLSCSLTGHHGRRRGYQAR